MFSVTTPPPPASPPHPSPVEDDDQPRKAPRTDEEQSKSLASVRRSNRFFVETALSERNKCFVDLLDEVFHTALVNKGFSVATSWLDLPGASLMWADCCGVLLESEKAFVPQHFLGKYNTHNPKCTPEVKKFLNYAFTLLPKAFEGCIFQAKTGRPFKDPLTRVVHDDCISFTQVENRDIAGQAKWVIDYDQAYPNPAKAAYPSDQVGAAWSSIKTMKSVVKSGKDVPYYGKHPVRLNTLRTKLLKIQRTASAAAELIALNGN